jgi:hypothetical protein
MTVEEWAVVACVVFTGLWSGLLAMLTTVLHKMLRPMEGREFALFLGGFLPPARKAPFNYLAILGMIASPVVALITLDSGSTAFVLVAIGLALTVAGPLLVSNRLAEPNYDVILGWNPEDVPRNWSVYRQRYFAYNWIRAVATWTSLAVFVAALSQA